MCSCIEGIPKCTNCFTDRKLRCLGHPISIVMFCDRSHENKEMITIRGTNARHNNRQYCPYNQKMIPTVSFCTFVSFFFSSVPPKRPGTTPQTQFYKSASYYRICTSFVTDLSVQVSIRCQWRFHRGHSREDLTKITANQMLAPHAQSMLLSADG